MKLWWLNFVTDGQNKSKITSFLTFSQHLNFLKKVFQNSKLFFWTKFGMIYAYYCIHLLLGCILFLCPSVTKFFWIDRTNIYISQNLCQIYPKKSFFLKIRVSNIRISSRFKNFFDFCFSVLLLRYFVIAPYILSELSEGKHVGAVLIDLKKAFDTVDHQIKKLFCYGFRDMSFGWF